MTTDKAHLMSEQNEGRAELLPCPFCGRTDLIIRADISEDEPTRSYAFHVFCRDCHCHGRNNFPIGWAESHDAAIDAWNRREPAEAVVTDAMAPLQARVHPWMMACFGPEISADRIERNHRFIEEALELVQSTGCTQSEAHQLVDYVYGRPVGEPIQEVGGVMITLAALCLANDMDMHEAGETELARIWTKVEKIRAKQAAKPKHSPLPEALTVSPPRETEIAVTDEMVEQGAVALFRFDYPKDKWERFGQKDYHPERYRAKSRQALTAALQQRGGE